MLSYSGRHTMILGGNCTIGLETARLLLNTGLDVTLTVRSKAAEEAARMATASFAVPFHLADAASQKEQSVKQSGATQHATEQCGNGLHHNGSFTKNSPDTVQSGHTPDRPSLLQHGETSGLPCLSFQRLDLCDTTSIDRVCSSLTPNYVVDCIQPDLEGFIAAVDPCEAQTYFASSIINRQRVLYHLTRAMLAKGRQRKHNASSFDDVATTPSGIPQAKPYSGTESKNTTNGSNITPPEYATEHVPPFRLVYLSSTAAQAINAGQGLYAAAKRAAEALYTATGIELAERGVTTAILRAGYVDAGRGANYLTTKPDSLKTLPAGRPLTAQDVAGNLAWLLSDQALGINATAVTLDGGMLAGKGSI